MISQGRFRLIARPHPIRQASPDTLHATGRDDVSAASNLLAHQSTGWIKRRPPPCSNEKSSSDLIAALSASPQPWVIDRCNGDRSPRSGAHGRPGSRRRRRSEGPAACPPTGWPSPWSRRTAARDSRLIRTQKKSEFCVRGGGVPLRGASAPRLEYCGAAPCFARRPQACQTGRARLSRRRKSPLWAKQSGQTHVARRSSLSCARPALPAG